MILASIQKKEKIIKVKMMNKKSSKVKQKIQKKDGELKLIMKKIKININ